MADKVSVKTIPVISFFCGIIMILCGCEIPVDIDLFMEDDTVQEVIEENQKTVIIDPSSDGTLTPGFGKITGLDPDKYYMLEKETDISGGDVNPTGYPRFVTEYTGLRAGQLWNNITRITKIKGRTIITLTNDHIYTVKTAKPFASASITYTDSAVTNTPVSITNSLITIPNPKGTVTINLSSQLSGAFDVMAVANPSTPTSPSWNPMPSTPFNTSDFTAFQLEAPGTTVDYVFFQKSTLTFKFLTVKIDPAVIDIKAIPGVTPPAFGETPKRTITETAQYTGTIAWSPTVTGTFAASTAYTATITLTPKAGYTLTGVGSNFFTVAGATTVTNPANSGVVTAVFPDTGAAPATTINIAAIPGVTKPVTGAVPVTAITETTQYTGTVTWNNGNPATFAASTAYTATITLTAKPGYTLTGVVSNFFTVADATATNPANSGVVTAVFPATGAASDTIIDIAAIPGVTKPVTGETPVTAITETAQYTGTVTWTPTVTGGKFAAGTSYTATITLSAKSGYTLTGVGSNFFTVAGATTVTNPANSGVVTAVFPDTAEATGDVTLTITFTNGDKINAGGTSNLVLSTLTGASTVNFTLSVNGGGNTENIKWYQNGSILAGQTANTLNLNAMANIGSLVVGTHIFTVVADIGGVTYSTNFTLTVTK